MSEQKKTPVGQVACNSAKMTADIVTRVREAWEQAHCDHPDTIYDNYAVICTACGKQLRAGETEHEQREWRIATEGLARLVQDFGRPRVEKTHGNGITDYESFKNSECQALIDRRSA